MKKVGILLAEEKELEAFKNLVDVKKQYNIFGLTIYETVVENINVVFVECGIGKVNAARTAQILIDNMQVDYLFNAGVAGGLDEGLSIGDIVIGEKLVQHDFDLRPLRDRRGFIPGVGDFVESDSYLISLANNAIKKIKNVNVKHGVIASGDIFVREAEMSRKVNKRFNALACEMEGAAVGQVCKLCNIPFLILRSISDIPNNKNEIDFEMFLESASKVIAEAMYNLLKELGEAND